MREQLYGTELYAAPLPIVSCLLELMIPPQTGWVAQWLERPS